MESFRPGDELPKTLMCTSVTTRALPMGGVATGVHGCNDALVMANHELWNASVGDAGRALTVPFTVNAPKPSATGSRPAPSTFAMCAGLFGSTMLTCVDVTAYAVPLSATTNATIPMTIPDAGALVRPFM